MTDTPNPRPPFVRALYSSNDGITEGRNYRQTDQDKHYRWVITDDGIEKACLPDRFVEVEEVSPCPKPETTQ